MSTQPTSMDARHQRLATALTLMGERTAARTGSVTRGIDDPDAAGPGGGALDLVARVIARERRPVRVLIPFAGEEVTA